MTRQVEVIGHRGARGLFPENTLEGFRDAFALGVCAFELDVGVTADDVAVVSHDLTLTPVLTRDAAGAWLTGPGPRIRDLTLAQLRAYDVGRIRPGTGYRLLFRRQKGRDGARVPTLEQVLRSLPDAAFIVELKTDPRLPDQTVSPAHMAEVALRAIDAAGAAGRVVIESFDWRGPRHVARIRPDIPLAWLTRAETVHEAALWWDGDTPARHGGSVPAAVAAQYVTTKYVTTKYVTAKYTATQSAARPRPGSWAPAFETLTRKQMEEARALGLRVLPWTVNRRAAMRRLIRWGVDGLITDRPDVALSETAAFLTGRAAD